MSSTSPLNLPGLVQGKSQVEVWGTTSLSLYPGGGREKSKGFFFTHFLPHVTLEGEMILFYHFFFVLDNTPALYLIPSWNSRRLCSKIHRCTVIRQSACWGEEWYLISHRHFILLIKRVVDIQGIDIHSTIFNSNPTGSRILEFIRNSNRQTLVILKELQAIKESERISLFQFVFI